MKINLYTPGNARLFSKIRWTIFMSSLMIIQLCSAQIPSMGDVENYTLFTNTGAFNNTGSSKIIGDIGTQVGAYTGFPPGVLSGQSHIADSTSVRIATLVTSLYAYFEGLTGDSVIGVGLGNNQVLISNIYTIGAASTLNGNLILDAQGDPNAKFVIKIDGALTSSAFSSISLINFASVCNVYWQINGLFSLADSSIFRGTLLINGAINLYNGSKLEGRALSVAGAINIDNVIADITCLNSALPICLTNFQASCDAGQPLVNWSTSSEMNNDYFILYRSQDGKLWEPAAQLKGAGNTLVQKNYSFIDHSSFSAFTYYRLMQMDYNGKYEYSSIVWIKSCNKNKSLNQVYPNPTKGIIKFKHIESNYNTYSLAIYNSTGKMVYFSKKFKKSVDLSMFENGRYTILFSTDGINSTQEIVLSK